VLVNGQNIGSMRRAAIPYLRRNLGLIFQDQKLLYDRSVFDNVMLPLAFTGHAHKDAARRARAALDKVGLLAREKANPIALSGGEQQRLCIARAVVNRPSILLADEPTASLDSASAAESSRCSALQPGRSDRADRHPRRSPDTTPESARAGAQAR